MAAYAALLSVTQTLDKVMHLGKQQIDSLREKLSFLKAFLENHPPNSNEAFDLLQGRIRDVAYHAEDLIESHISGQFLSEYEWFGFKRGFRQSVSAIQKAVFPGRQGERWLMPSVYKFKKENLQRVIEEIDSVVEEATKIKTSSKAMDQNPPPIINTDPLSTNSKQVVGLEEDLMKIKDWLCGESSKLQIISLVGMGGIGKTNLAKNIFDDPLVVYHFHTRAWVTISQQYSTRDILLGILNSKTAINSKDLGQEISKENVYKSLKGRRYLIIMDDIWSIEAWDDVKRIFPDDNNGSRIILTTRLSDVAIYAGSSNHLHYMQLLTEDQSWNLLKKKVFEQECCIPQLEIIGKKIARKCHGLPLAIVLVAGALSKVLRTTYDWEMFDKNIVGSILVAEDENFAKITSLSYNHLPHHLKPCFLYFGGFPEDYEISVSKLLQLWIAEGFVNPVRSKTFEEVAEEYLEDLARRNLILITKKSSVGKSKLCSIHDLLRDFCIKKAKDENFLHVKRNDQILQEDIESKRRLFFCNPRARDLPMAGRFYSRYQNFRQVLASSTGTYIRSVFYYCHHLHLEYLIAASKLLRVFDGLEAELVSFPVEVTILFHLRYLCFTHRSSWYYPTRIPASISKLRNLQTLIIRRYPSYSDSTKLLERAVRPDFYLPYEIWRMPQLRHLILHDVCILPHPTTRGKSYVLQNLQTLSRVKNFSFTDDVIVRIPNLKKLGVFYSHWNSRKWSKYQLNNLSLFHQLESLDLAADCVDWLQPFPGNFTLPKQLKKISLRGTGLRWENMTVVGSLPNLQVLKLRFFAFIGDEWETIDGEFPKLKYLLMDSLFDLKWWRTEKDHFPSLERLIIQNCPQLVEIPSEIGELPTLQLIEVCCRCVGPAKSAMQIQEEQRGLGNDSLQVRFFDCRRWYNMRIY